MWWFLMSARLRIRPRMGYWPHHCLAVIRSELRAMLEDLHMQYGVF